MKNIDNPQLTEYSTKDLARMLFVKIWQKKGVKLAVSGAAVLLCACIAETLRANRMTGNAFGGIMEIITFTVMILSAAYFTSNIGVFKKRKFTAGASVVTVMLLAAVPAVKVLAGIDPSDPGNVSLMIFRVTLYHVPIFLIAFGAVMALGTLVFRQKKQV